MFAKHTAVHSFLVIEAVLSQGNILKGHFYLLTPKQVLLRKTKLLV